AVPAVRQAGLDRGAVPGREVVGFPLGAKPRDRAGARGAAGAADGAGDDSDAGAGVARDPSGSVAVLGVGREAHPEPVPDRLEVAEVLCESRPTPTKRLVPGPLVKVSGPQPTRGEGFDSGSLP